MSLVNEGGRDEGRERGRERGREGGKKRSHSELLRVVDDVIDNNI